MAPEPYEVVPINAGKISVVSSPHDGAFKLAILIDNEDATFFVKILDGDGTALASNHQDIGYKMGGLRLLGDSLVVIAGR